MEKTFICDVEDYCGLVIEDWLDDGRLFLTCKDELERVATSVVLGREDIKELVKGMQRFLSTTTPKARLLADMEQAIAKDKRIYALHFELPNGAKETHIVNNEDIAAKRTFVSNNYNDELSHNNSKGVRIVASGGFDSLSAINDLIIK